MFAAIFVTCSKRDAAEFRTRSFLIGQHVQLARLVVPTWLRLPPGVTPPPGDAQAKLKWEDGGVKTSVPLPPLNPPLLRTMSHMPSQESPLAL